MRKVDLLRSDDVTTNRAPFRPIIIAPIEFSMFALWLVIGFFELAVFVYAQGQTNLWVIMAAWNCGAISNCLCLFVDAWFLESSVLPSLISTCLSSSMSTLF